VYGDVQDLKYGCAPGQVKFAAFDIFDSKTGKYLEYEQFEKLCKRADIPMVPVIYRGGFVDGMANSLAEGQSVVDRAKNIREGVVVRSLVGRKILKMVSEAYLLRKNGTERH
jgi:ATP-dependent RNA circularization protein (DNA/RNA ligase family)